MMKKRFLGLVGLLSLWTIPAMAANGPQSLGTFGFWRAFQVNEGSQPVCYMSLSGPAPQPLPDKTKGKKAGKPPKRGDVTLMITHRPAEGSKDVVSYAAGLKFKPGSEALVRADDKTFNLFTQNDTAWSRDAATDHALASAIRKAKTLSVSGETAHGEPLGDTVNLKGAPEAYRAISKACGLAVDEPKKPATPAPKAKPAKENHR